MFKALLQQIVNLYILFTRPLTLGARGVLYDPATGSILLVKHSYTGEWALPGGGTEIGESLINSINREILEETGIRCKTVKIMDAYHNSIVSKRDHVVIYLVEDWLMEEESRRLNIEIAEIAWFKLDSLPKTLTPCSKHGLEVCSLIVPQDNHSL